ncbi:ABC transporter permease subunit [Roseateles sp. PN1]|uniref:ABC transporter permease subunit n=1 Tax=Roseateles sp. PN1 TaxID=3137372 RepID=UPI0031399577
MSALLLSSNAWRPAWLNGLRGRHWVIGLPYAWLLLFFLAPFAVVLNFSLSQMGLVRPDSLLRQIDGAWQLTLRSSNFSNLLGDGLYFNAYLASLRMAAFTTLGCLLLGYPFAYFMARAKPARQGVLLMLVMAPFWTSFLLRVYAWKLLLGEGGWLAALMDSVGLDHVLLWLGLIEAPGKYMHTPFSLMLGLLYSYLPFMILPLYAGLAKMDLRLLEAAHDLGATPWQAFWRITVPLSRGAIAAGSMLVFIPCIGEYVIPELLGGPRTLMIGKVLWEEFFNNNDWPMACAVAVVLLLLIVLPLSWLNRVQDREARA